MSEYIYYNLNPLKKHTGDCVIRAFAFFFNITWKDAFLDIINWCADRGVVTFNFRSTYYEYLIEKGFAKNKPQKKGITIGEFIEKYAEKESVYIVQTKRHLSIVNHGKLVDTWDCSDKVLDAYWVRNGIIT